MFIRIQIRYNTKAVGVNIVLLEIVPEINIVLVIGNVVVDEFGGNEAVIVLLDRFINSGFSIIGSVNHLLFDKKTEKWFNLCERQE